MSPDIAQRFPLHHHNNKKWNVRNLTPETRTEVEQLFAPPLDENIRNRQPVIFRFLHKAHIHIQRTKTHETNTDRAHLHNTESIERPATVGSCPCPLELWEKTSRWPQHATELPGRNHPGRWCRTQRACVLAPELGPTALELCTSWKFHGIYDFCPCWNGK